MRKAVWLWVVVAFVVGLAPGGATSWWLWQTGRESRTQLAQHNAGLDAENKRLQTRLNAAEASVSALGTRLEQARGQAPWGVPSATSASAASTGGGTPTGPPTITERAVAPQATSPSGKITLSVKLKGHADKVDMRLVARAGGFDKIHYLAKTSSDASGETWEKVIEAPTAKGEYRYYAIAWAGGVKYTMPGVSGWSFVVQ